MLQVVRGTVSSVLAPLPPSPNPKEGKGGRRDRSLLVPMTLSDLVGGTRGVLFTGGCPYVRSYRLTQHDQIRHDNTREEGRRGFLWVKHVPPIPRLRYSRTPKFLDTYLRPYATKCCGRCVSRGSCTPSSQ